MQWGKATGLFTHFVIKYSDIDVAILYICISKAKKKSKNKTKKQKKNQCKITLKADIVRLPQL